MPGDRPNVLILMTDQQRADCLSCAGHPQLRTPNMDRLAEEGVRFSRACTTSPLCVPARASFISGRYVHTHGMWDNRGELPADYASLFRRLQGQGYHTAHVGKSHYYQHGGFDLRDREDYMHARGFDYVHETTGPWATVSTESYMTGHWRELGLLEAFRDDYRRRQEKRGSGAVDVRPSPLPTEEFMDSYVGREGVRFLEQYDGDDPFCLFVGFGGPHEPWDAPGEYATMYDPAQAPTPVDVEPAEPGSHIPEEAAEWQRHGRQDRLTAENIAELRVNYYGKIALIDQWFGRLLDVCAERGWLDELLIVFWSDHGEMAGDHRLLYKSRFYESALRVPLIVRWPGRIPRGAISEGLAQTVDIMPTVLDAAGAEVPPGSEGRSLLPVMRDPSLTVREAALSEVHSAGRRIVMVCTERHKYAAFEDGTGYLLHDLEEDPDETDNLIGHPDHRDVQERMEALWRKRRRVPL